VVVNLPGQAPRVRASEEQAALFVVEDSNGEKRVSRGEDGFEGK
jgi:hypothetical protein